MIRKKASGAPLKTMHQLLEEASVAESQSTSLATQAVA
jgi:hypothetical protein